MPRASCWIKRLALAGVLMATASPAVWGAAAARFAAATFEADITIPIGHACMGGGVADAKEIVDPLWAKGFVLMRLPDEKPEAQAPWFAPIVVIALDWCQCNNDSYDRWRSVLAQAAGTEPRRVMLATVHQHDAPIFDLRAQQLLDQYGLKGWNCDPAFHEQALERTAAALRKALKTPRRVTHIGVGQAEVQRIASNRRVVTPEGRIHWGRGSASGDLYGAPEGQIDPWLKTLSLWDGDRPVLAWSCYAVHPMSYYGQGQVSADFPGMARAWRQRDDPQVFQIYFTGCAGDTTAGKYNTGDPANRPELAKRLYQAMLAAWKATVRHPLEDVAFRCAPLHLPPRDTGNFTLEAMRRILSDPKATRWQRISAALGLSWRERVAAGRPIDVPCVEFNRGQALFAILPAESFVGYQLAAQRLRPEGFVMVAGFGDGAPGYIPTDQCWKEGYQDDYCWVAPMTEGVILNALRQALGAPPAAPPPAHPQKPLEIRQEVIKRELHPDFCWFHPRAAVVPHLGGTTQPGSPPRPPRVLITLQKHLKASDHYSGLYTLWTDDLGATWKGPTEIPELGWVPQPDGSTLAVADVTPSYHPPTGKVLAIGCSVYYGSHGEQLHDRPRFSQTAYAVYDPRTDRWSRWAILELPPDEKFNLARNGCGQWLVEEDGRLLVPIYFAPRVDVPFGVTVLRCVLDGDKLRYLEHGDELHLPVQRGLCEPSLIRFGSRYFLTLRNDLKGYVTAGTDGLHWQPIRPWTFDDGTELGSYNTQQHWVAHRQGLYLCYTRRGANNDHIVRHRAPLFIARVDPEKLHVLRATEQVLIPERGAMLGNFGAAAIDTHEAWVTDAEYYMGTQPHPRGADGTVWLARIRFPSGS